MCNRSKVEITAREFCIEYVCGARSVNPIEVENITEFVDKHWTKWEAPAIKFLEVLDKHE